MGSVVLVLRLVLAGVFALSGASKLADLKGSREALKLFGAPSGAAGPLSLALPLTELAVAALMLFEGTAIAGGIAALALLGAFSIAIAVNLAQGRRPACHCFGQLSSEPIGFRTLGRNAGLASIAVLVVGLGADDVGPSAVAWIGDLSGTEAGLLALGMALAIVLALGIEVPSAERSLPEPAMLALPIPAPAFELPAVGGGFTSVDDLLEGGLPVLLAFTDPGCGPCEELAPSIAGWQANEAEAVTVVVVSGGDLKRAEKTAARHGLTRVLLDEDGAVAESLAAIGTPSGVLLAPSGNVVSEVAPGSEQIRGLMQVARDYSAATSAPSSKAAWSA